VELIDLFIENKRNVVQNFEQIFLQSEGFELKALLLGGLWNYIFSDGGPRPNTDNSGGP